MSELLSGELRPVSPVNIGGILASAQLAATKLSLVIMGAVPHSVPPEASRFENSLLKDTCGHPGPGL